MPSRSDLRQAIIGIALVACGGRPLPDGDIAASLQTAPPLAGTFDPQSLHGKPTMVVFVSPTCTHCLKELPLAQEAAHGAGANIVAVFVTGGRDNAKSLVAQTKFTGPALFDDGTLKARYAVDKVPYLLVLGADGHARDALLGEQDEDTLRDAISRAL
jgi:thiol-disulfide isomerase/thioredoxin